MQNRETALITGASFGIGYELAQIFARKGYDLVMVARTEGKLNEMAKELSAAHKVNVKVIAKDLILPSSPQEIFDELKAENISIDILVNNAGVGTFGRFWETDLKTQLDMIQINISALTHLTGLFLPDMIERGKGKILNVGSTAGFQPGPLMAVYYATKSYVLLFSEALANELKRTGITVTTLCPGPVKTEFQRRAKLEKNVFLLKGKIFEPDTIAEAGYKGLMKGKSIVIPGLMFKAPIQMSRFFPRKLITKVSGLLLKQRQ
ncbi:SDR family NAD(P)-dependent oxidoreductase [Bdellovibrionota bacterium]